MTFPGRGQEHPLLPGPGQGPRGLEGGPWVWATLPGSTFCSHTLCDLGQVSSVSSALKEG